MGRTTAMPDSIPLHNGGPLFHPDDPLGFHPSLRAAGHLLVAGERAVPGLARSLRDEVLPHHPVNPIALRSPNLRIDPDDGADLHRVEGREPLSRPAARARRSARLFIHHLLRWAGDRHLRSPYVLEVLLLTLLAWREIDRRQALAEADRRDIPPDVLASLPPGASPAVPLYPGSLIAPPAEASSPDAAPATLWGPWVAALTTAPEEADVLPLLELHVHVPFLHLSDRTGLEKATSRLTLDLPPWRPQIEPWEEREQQLREHFESVLETHRRSTLERYRSRGYEPVPVKTAPHHFDWLAQRQLQARRPGELARRARVGRATVHAALKGLSEMLELKLRPVKQGREGW